MVAFVGWAWGRSRQPFDAMSFSAVSTYIGTPCLIIDSLGNSGLRLHSLAAMGIGASLCTLIALAAGFVLVKASRQPMATYLPASAFANTGNIGLPLTLFAFGKEGMALAIAYLATHSVFNFVIGQALAAGRFSLLKTVFSPLLWATAIAAALSATGTELPLMLARAVHILGELTIPLMLLALGYSLSELAVTSLAWPLAFSALRLLGGFAIGWGVAFALGLSGVERGVLVMESAMPAAVYNYMFAARYNNHPEDSAGLVVVSTLLALFALPVFLWTVL